MYDSFDICCRWSKFLLSGACFAALGLTACHPKPEPSRVAQAITSQPSEPANAVAERAEEKSCRHFVQGFYDWYFDRLNSEDSRPKGAPTYEEEVMNLKPAVLMPPLLQMIRADSDAEDRHPGYIVGLDFDPYIGAQDWNGKYTVQRVTVKDGTCRAVLFGDDAGTRVEMVDAELQNINGTWIFANFHYPYNGKPNEFDLIAQLKTLRENDKRAKEKRPINEPLFL